MDHGDLKFPIIKFHTTIDLKVSPFSAPGRGLERQTLGPSRGSKPAGGLCLAEVSCCLGILRHALESAENRIVLFHVMSSFGLNATTGVLAISDSDAVKDVQHISTVRQKTSCYF